MALDFLVSVKCKFNTWHCKLVSGLAVLGLVLATVEAVKTEANAKATVRAVAKFKSNISEDKSQQTASMTNCS